MKSNRLTIVLLSLVFALQSCDYNKSETIGSSSPGKGGSMARFTIIGNHLFTVDENNLKTFDISNSELPEYKGNNPVGRGVETIFPMNDKLFLGTRTGMFIYDVSNPVAPKRLSFYQHIYACDPVVSDGEYAYVTLSSNQNGCWRSRNELQIVDVKNLSQPKPVKQYPLKRPRGLAIRNDTLWVCDNGIKIFDVTDKMNIKQLYHFNEIVAYDVILDKNRALVIGESGFVQYKLNGDAITKLSEIKVGL